MITLPYLGIPKQAAQLGVAPNYRAGQGNRYDNSYTGSRKSSYGTPVELPNGWVMITRKVDKHELSDVSSPWPRATTKQLMDLVVTITTKIFVKQFIFNQCEYRFLSCSISSLGEAIGVSRP